MSSSIPAAAATSRDDVGSSRRRTAGSRARARARQRRCCWPPERSVRVQPVPDLLPEPRASERFFRGCGDLPFRHPPHRFQRYRDIAVYADRQYVRSLKDHSHKAPQFTDRAFPPVNVFHASPEVDFHAPRRSAAWKCLVQPVQRPQERGLARTGPACEHGDAPRGRFQGNAVQDFRFPESDMEIADAAG